MKKLLTAYLKLIPLFILVLAFTLLLHLPFQGQAMAETPEAKPQPPVLYFGVSEEELDLMAKTVYGEANGLCAYEKSLVCWCILNRVDAGGYGGTTIKEVILAPKQFYGYKASHPVTEENLAIVKDVIARWATESYLIGDSGRTLPRQYTFFYGDGKHNYYSDPAKNRYDFDLEDPYDNNGV